MILLTLYVVCTATSSVASAYVDNAERISKVAQPQPPDDLRRRLAGLDCEDVWDVAATDSSGTWTCKQRIDWLASNGRSDTDAKAQVAQEFPDLCGPCDPDSLPAPGTERTCEDVWNIPAVDRNGDWTCGERINYLQEVRGRSSLDARDQVADEIPETCGPCAGDNGGNPQPAPEPTPSPIAFAELSCEDVWDTPAIDSNGSWSCGERIEWLVSSRGFSNADARAQVVREIPTTCGPCAPEESNPGPLPVPPPSDGGSADLDLTVVTQNLFWWNLFDRQNGGRFFDEFPRFGPYDIMLFQECDDVSRVVSGLGYPHDFEGGNRALAVTWDRSRFTKLASGYDAVGEDRPGLWGERGVAWVRLRDNRSGKTIWAGSHHGPLPINTGGLHGGSAVAGNISSVVDRRSEDGDVIVLGGDFNADGNSGTVRELRNLGFTDHVTDWVDHMMTRGSGLGAPAGHEIISGTGSDHRGLKVVWSS